MHIDIEYLTGTWIQSWDTDLILQHLTSGDIYTGWRHSYWLIRPLSVYERTLWLGLGTGTGTYVTGMY